MIKILLIYICIVINNCYSHPVIWKNGIVSNVKFSNQIAELKTHYSATSQWAIGAHLLQLDSHSYGMAQSNVLLNRWNQKESQANIYFFQELEQI